MPCVANSNNSGLVPIIASFLIIGLIILLIVLIKGGLEWSHFNGALDKAFRNDFYCKDKGNECVLTSDNTLTQPQESIRQFSHDMARYCADLIVRIELQASKKDVNADIMMPPCMSLIKKFVHKNKVVGFLSKSTSGMHWLVFRGSVTQMEWRNDFSYKEISPSFSPLFGHQTAHVGEQAPTAFEPSGLLCHRGFLDVYESLRYEITKALRSEEITDLIITGHSSGSALGTLACIDLADKYKITGYMFGTPRVCNEVPINNTNGFYRINNTTDVIKDTPLAVTANLSDKNNPYFYKHSGTKVTFTENRKSIEQNHSLLATIQAIVDERLEISETQSHN